MSMKMPHRGVQYGVIIWHENAIELNDRIRMFVTFISGAKGNLEFDLKSKAAHTNKFRDTANYVLY